MAQKPSVSVKIKDKDTMEMVNYYLKIHTSQQYILLARETEMTKKPYEGTDTIMAPYAC